MALTVSEKPWSDYTEADYSLEQWHAACLIHQHSGSPTSKQQCKLPVKTPSGTLNRNGVIAAAGALAGARTPINASSEEKSKAAKTLINYYRQMNMKPTPKLLALAHSDMSEFLSHHGVKGMRWGVRKAEDSGVNVKVLNTSRGTRIKTTGGDHQPAHPDAIAAAIANQKLRKSGKASLSNAELQLLSNRLNLEQNVSRLNANDVNPGAKFVKGMIGNMGKQLVSKLVVDVASKQIENFLKRKLATVAVSAVL